MSRIPLTDEQLLELINRDDLSDFEVLSDEDDRGWEDDIIEEVERDDEETIEDEEVGQNNNSIIENNYEEPDEENEIIEQEPNNTNEGEAHFQQFFREHNLTEKKNIKWIKNSQYMTREIEWYTPGIPEVHELESPTTFFMKYIPVALLQDMVEFTNLYATQKNLNRFPLTTLTEMKIFLGIHIIMGNLQFPRVRMYWDAQMGIPLIKESMACNRFFKLRNAVHLVDITDRGDNPDRLWKVRPIYESVRNRCLQLPVETFLCVDEQIIPFKGQINIKQYMKNKPKKWGIKVYVLAGQSGLIYDFLIYQGSTTPIKPTYSKFGAGAATVMQLVERIDSDGKNRGIFIDNYFGTYNLFQYLDSKNIFSVGTVRLNRFANPPLMTDKEMKKKERGVMDSVVSQDGIVVTKWFDNKPVTVASNFIGEGNPDTCTRWDKKQKNM